LEEELFKENTKDKTMQEPIETAAAGKIMFEKNNEQNGNDHTHSLQEKHIENEKNLSSE